VRYPGRSHGPDEAIDRAEQASAAVAKETLRVGGVGAASRLKLVVNYWALGLTALTGEVPALADGLDVGGERFLKLIEGGFAESTYAQLKGKKMLTRDWAPLFSLSLGRKDVALVLDAAAGAGLDLTLGEAVLEDIDRAIARGYGDGDTAAVIEAIRPGSA
jgi:3-hydroxyisobutyrate dehydrogenase